MTGEKRSRVDPWKSLGLELLKRRYHLPADSGSTLNDLLEALACQQLGFPEKAEWKDVRDPFLCRFLGISERLRGKDLIRQIIGASAGARRADLNGVREAVLRDWLTPSPSRPSPAANGQPRAERVEAEAFDLPAFAATVQAAARACPTGWFGDNKVFIHRVWEQLQGETHLPVRSLDEFKQRLVEANRAGLLHLSRADLPQVMDPADVRQSETRYLDAVFHFLRTEGDRS